MEKQKTKREKLAEIIEFLEANEGSQEHIDLLKNEIAIITNKYDGAKLKKDANKEKEYAVLEKQVLEFFKNDKNLLVGNMNIELPISTSKKTAVLQRLFKKGTIKILPPKGKQKVTLYQLA